MALIVEGDELVGTSMERETDSNISFVAIISNIAYVLKPLERTKNDYASPR